MGILFLGNVWSFSKVSVIYHFVANCWCRTIGFFQDEKNIAPSQNPKSAPRKDVKNAIFKKSRSFLFPFFTRLFWAILLMLGVKLEQIFFAWIRMEWKHMSVLMRHSLFEWRGCASSISCISGSGSSLDIASTVNIVYLIRLGVATTVFLLMTSLSSPFCHFVRGLHVFHYQVVFG